MRFILFILVMLTFLLQSNAQETSRLKEFNLENGVAIKGYDPVAYFKESKAAKGNEKYSHVYRGVKYYFSSEANKTAFIAKPEAYEPQYGGWCAYAMGETGDRVEVDPKTFKITDGKLYLFYNFYFTNTLTPWNKNEAELRKQADRNWINQFK